MLNTKEHIDLMRYFERDFAYMRLDREPKEMWSKGRIYQNGNTNTIFLTFRAGYSYGKCVWGVM